MSKPRFFQLLVWDGFTGERPGWYWQDDDCEEPMGPFPSYREAALDHREMRPFSSKNGGRMNTVAQWLEKRGRKFPAPDGPDDSTSAAAYEAAGLPMIVACTNCTMTMALHGGRKIDDEGQVYCDDCAEAVTA